MAGKNKNNEAKATINNEAVKADVVQSENSLPIGIDGTIRQRYIDKVHTAFVNFDNKQWELAQAISDVMTADDYKKAFKNDEDFASVLKTTKGNLSKYKNCVALRDYVLAKGVSFDFSISQTQELVSTFNDYKRKELDFMGFLDKYAITSEMSVTDIRKVIKESKNLSIGVKQSESAENDSADKATNEVTENTESTGTMFDENGNVESVNGRKNVITDAESHISLCIKGVRCGDIDTENSDLALDIAMVLYKYGYKVIVDTLVDNGIVNRDDVTKSHESLMTVIDMMNTQLAESAE